MNQPCATSTTHRCDHDRNRYERPDPTHLVHVHGNGRCQAQRPAKARLRVGSPHATTAGPPMVAMPPCPRCGRFAKPSRSPWRYPTSRWSCPGTRGSLRRRVGNGATAMQKTRRRSLHVNELGSRSILTAPSCSRDRRARRSTMCWVLSHKLCRVVIPGSHAAATSVFLISDSPQWTTLRVSLDPASNSHRRPWEKSLGGEPLPSR